MFGVMLVKLNDGRVFNMTPKQVKFADLWLACRCNGTKAAKAAGYSGNANVLGVAAYRLLRHPKIIAYQRVGGRLHSPGSAPRLRPVDPMK
jgi:hypothetical protein